MRRNCPLIIGWKFALPFAALASIGCVPNAEPAAPEASGPPSVTQPVVPVVSSAPTIDANVTDKVPDPAGNTRRSGRPFRSGDSSVIPDMQVGSTPDKLKQGVIERADAARMVINLLKESTGYAPTLAVWIVDRSASCREMIGDFGRLTRSMIGELPSGGSGKDAKLLTAVCSFGEDVKFVIDPPSADPAVICTAIEELPQDKSGQEVTFAAVKAALDKYLKVRTEQQREVLFILVTDEAGDDAGQLEAILEAPRKAGTPFYVVGVPAPFGKEAALTAQAEMGMDYKPSGNWLAIRQGPESIETERIRLGFWGGATDLDMLDSGFGPFALERLCRATGGRYLALRPDTGGEFAFTSSLNTQWPSPGVPRFDPEVMRRYAPDYVSAAEYQAALAANKAKQALVQASRLGDMELLTFPQTAFHKADEATMARVLSQAQQVAAKLEPGANALYEALEKGEADRAKLTEPRWQAGYDLAMGRAAAVKSRVDGYNSMLAALKRGKSFQNPASTGWTLDPAETIEGASALQKLIDKSKQYLKRVVDEHPGTPWAKIAERELQQPSGWKWTER